MARKRSSPLVDIPANYPIDDEIEQVDGDATDDEEQSLELNPQNEEDDAEEDDAEEDDAGEEDSEEDDAEEDGAEEDDVKEDDAEEDEVKEDDAEKDDPAPVDPKELSVQKKGSESSDGSGSDSESEESPPVTVKPIRSKPMEDLSNLKKPVPKSSQKRSSAKRPMESDQNGKDSRKKGRVSKGDEKRSAFNRLWSEEDEIGILQGLIDYQLEKDEDPYSDMDAFHEFVKGSLHVDVSMKQLTDKIRRLKKKYLVNAEKGDDVVFVKPHEDKSFELSKKIWGDGGKVRVSRRKDKDIGKVVMDGLNRKNGKNDVVMEDVVENGVEESDEEEGMDLKAMYPNLSRAWESDVTCSKALKDIMMEKFCLIGGEKMSGMEKEWKDIYVKEVKLYVKKLDLKKKQAQVVLDQMTTQDP